MQYNNDFYNFAFDDNKNQKHLFNYIFNCFNKYKRGLDILINIYIIEFEQNKNNIKIFIIIILTVFFIIFIGIYTCLIINYLSANNTRMKLIDIFYGISSDTIKSLMVESLNFINKMRESKEKKSLTEKEEDESLEEKKKM
jgi:MFS superfamily sulfate permease-like transporter